MARINKPLPSQERLQELFDYNPETGDLIWKEKTPAKRAGCKEDRYYTLRIKGETYKLHRIIWMYVYGEDPGQLIVDHINRNGFDNRLDNLRIGTQSNNGGNRDININNTSGYKGVMWSERECRWTSKVKVNNEEIRLGYFDDPELAYQAYLNKSKELHGEFACGGRYEIDPKEAERRRQKNKDYKERKRRRGINWNKQSQKWRVRVTLNGERKYLGSFKTFEEAKKVYDEEVKLVK